MPLGPFSTAARETKARAERACALAQAAMQLVQRLPPAGGKHVAWRICKNIILHSLDYDSRVLTSSLVLPHAAIVERSAWMIAEAVLGKPLGEQERMQMQLPTALSGCQLTMPTHTVPLARAADLMETGPGLEL